jgi:ribosomal protein S18 acetylase RimI-like enzyme
MNIIFKIASTNLEFDDGRDLFRQYTDSLNINMYSKDVYLELLLIDKRYNLPDGALLLVYDNNVAVGCAAIQKFNKNTAELKRFFVQTKYKGYKIGVQLLELAFDIAKELNYSRIRLDARPTITQTRSLFRSLGFYEIPPYGFNPTEETTSMEKTLV